MKMKPLVESPWKQRVLFFFAGLLFTFVCWAIVFRWWSVVRIPFDLQPAWITGLQRLVDWLPWIAMAGVIVLRLIKGRAIHAGAYSLGTLVATLTPTVVVMALLCLSPFADVGSTLQAGQKQVEPVVEAIEECRKGDGAYPASLDVLVKARKLDQIPRLPEFRGTRRAYPLDYRLSPDGSFYLLKFAYDFYDGIGPGSIITHYYVSDERKWNSAKYPPSFESLVADRAGHTFKEQGSYDALNLAVGFLLTNSNAGAGCVNLWESSVKDCLGPGEKIQLPNDLRRDRDIKSIRYGSVDARKPFYVFVFQSKVMMGMNADRSFSNREFQVARAVFEVSEDAERAFHWKLLAACR
jgi:hypothetical protein